MTVINTNGAALRALAASQRANTSISDVMARLSSGQRITSAKDDAAGMAIGNSMTAQIMGMAQGVRNTMDGISMVQTADGFLAETTNILQRLRELTIQSRSDTYGPKDRLAIQTEMSALSSHIDATLKNASFNGISLFRTQAPVYDDQGQVIDNAVRLDIQGGPGAANTVPLVINPVSTEFDRDKTAKTWDYPLLHASRDPGPGYEVSIFLTRPATAAGTETHLVTFDDYMAKGKIAGREITRDDIGTTVTQQIGDQWHDPDGAAKQFPFLLTSPSTTISPTNFHAITVEDFMAKAKVAGRPVTWDDIGTTVSQNYGDQWFDPTRVDNNDSRYLSFESATIPPQSHVVTAQDYMAGGDFNGRPIQREDIGTTVLNLSGARWYDPEKGGYFSQQSTAEYAERRHFTMAEELNVTNRYRIDNSLTRIDALLGTVSEVRAQMGASATRLQSAANDLGNASTNLSEARSRITDTDFSQESVNLAREQILSQSAIAMLAQAQQSQKDVLKLLNQ
ncbi:flagellin [Sphingomonas sp. CFBP8993]|uniref:flagellin N-terminal helical domain-containing protein n=2 Tax=Sphingomonas TaxID=13687 RepID=UPI002A6ABEFD|nr:flagellin [Sphingomonas sp. CFBP8993]MDY0959876.1 flagellin [Sphingomonas sp. CFBP8993]